MMLSRCLLTPAVRLTDAGDQLSLPGTPNNPARTPHHEKGCGDVAVAHESACSGVPPDDEAGAHAGVGPRREAVVELATPNRPLDVAIPGKHPSGTSPPGTALKGSKQAKTVLKAYCAHRASENQFTHLGVTA